MERRNAKEENVIEFVVIVAVLVVLAGFFIKIIYY